MALPFAPPCLDNGAAEEGCRLESKSGDTKRDVWRGLLAMAPLWVGVIPFALAFSVLARTAGFTTLETQAMSVLIFAGGAQVAIVTLFANGAGALAMAGTAALVNLRYLLYGMSLSRLWPERTAPPKPIAGLLMTDETYGLVIRDLHRGGGSPAYAFGASAGLFVVYNAATLVGSLAGHLLPDPSTIGLDFVFPLTFVALLLPLVRNKRQIAVALVSLVAVLIARETMATGAAIMTAATLAAATGVMLERSGWDGSAPS